MPVPPNSPAPESAPAARDQSAADQPARKPTRRRAPARAAATAPVAAPASGPVPPAGEPLQIVMIAAEAMPFAKEGGVADVLGSLPAALARLGHDVRLFLPRYGTIDPARWELVPTGYARTLYLGGMPQTVILARAAAPIGGVTAYFLDHDYYFGRHQKIYLGSDQIDEQRRYLLFCRAVIEALPALGLAPDIIHAHDWQAAPCAAYLRTSHAPLLRRPAPNAPGTAPGANGARPPAPPMTRLIYTIHNLQYQGRWDPAILDWAGLDRARVFVSDGLEYWGDVNWMKAGIVYADAITTVSRTYASEIQTLDYGQGLDELLTQRRGRLFGIPNGIDWEAWNPATDTAIAAAYAADESPAAIAAAKARNRAALRAEMGLPAAEGVAAAGVPVVGMVTRLADQKGLDLIAAIADDLRGLPLQLAVLGAGQERYEALFRDLAATSDNIRAVVGFDAPLSRRIYAGSDFFLMPSAFEPGGLGQLIALRYGTLPIVRATGGLADTVTDLGADPAHGNGVTFGPYEPAALLDALKRALALSANHTRWPALLRRAMTYDSRWSASAAAYADLYRRVLRLPPTGGLA